MSNAVSLPKDIKRSLWNWAQKEQDADTPVAHIFGIVCSRLGEVDPTKMVAIYAGIRQTNNWTQLLEKLGPPKS